MNLYNKGVKILIYEFLPSGFLYQSWFESSKINIKKGIKSSHVWILLSLTILFLFPKNQYAQIKLPSFPDSIFSTYYQQKKSFAESLPVEKDALVFLGTVLRMELNGEKYFNLQKCFQEVSAGVLQPEY